MTIIVPSTLSTTTPTRTIASLVPDISVFLQGCPGPVIERTILKMAIDLAERAKVWQLDAAPITLSASTTDYTITMVETCAEPMDIVSAYLILSDGTQVDLPWVRPDVAQRAYPGWPADNEGEPKYITSYEASTALLAPTPDATADLYVKVMARPKRDAAELPQWFCDAYRRCIHHGVLHELLLMPDRSWTDNKLGEYHGRQWTYLLNNAKARATLGNNVGSVSVEMRPFA